MELGKNYWYNHYLMMLNVAKKSIEKVSFYFLLRSWKFCLCKDYRKETQINDVGRIADEWQVKFESESW